MLNYYYYKLFMLAALYACASHDFLIVEACSSRTVPKPRPSISSSPSISMSSGGSVFTATTSSPILSNTKLMYTTTTTTTTPRPNITFPTYKCPDDFDAWYCLNDATCFAVKIGAQPVYSCECAVGFIGPRCEYKELDGSFMPKRPNPMLEKASIASGATCALLFMLFVGLTLYLCYDQKAHELELYDELQNETAMMTSSSLVADSCCGCCCNCSQSQDQRCYRRDDNGKQRKGSSLSFGLIDKLTYRQRLENALLSFAIKRST